MVSPRGAHGSDGICFHGSIRPCFSCDYRRFVSSLQETGDISLPRLLQFKKEIKCPLAKRGLRLWHVYGTTILMGGCDHVLISLIVFSSPKRSIMSSSMSQEVSHCLAVVRWGDTHRKGRSSIKRRNAIAAQKHQHTSNTKNTSVTSLSLYIGALSHFTT
jgi:hypothetical protein